MNALTLANGFRLVQANAVAPQPWRNGGGRTRELLTWPPTPDWRLRISRADIEADGPFSAFDGITRWFCVIEGAGVVLDFAAPQSHGAARSTTLRAGDAPLQFDGASAPACTLLQGPTQDLNLMARAGRSTLQAVVPGAAWAATYTVCGIYTAGTGQWQSSQANGQTTALHLPAHSLLWWCSETDANAAPQATPSTATPSTATPSTANALPAHWAFQPETPGAHAWWLGYTPDTP